MDTTSMVVTGCFIFLGLYDLVVVTRSGVASSVSRFLQRSALKSPIVSIVFGAMIGHLFMYMKPECEPCTVVPPPQAEVDHEVP